MYCRNCDYSLWNIPGRQCPECGDAFLPSEYEFKPGAVKFCCPDCSQQYYGTSYKGHLRPNEFDCVECGRHLEMDEMTLLPAEGWDEHSVGSATSPWVRPNKGLIKRWFCTVGWSYVNPRGLIAGIPVSSGVGGSFGFFMITQCLIGLVGIALPVLLFTIIIGLSTPRGGIGLAGLSATLLPSLLVVSGSIFVAILWGLLIHATLALTGGTAHSVGRTMSSVFFASGTLAAQAVPCVGPYCLGYIVGVWWVVSTILMVMESQKVSGLRASLAVLWPPLLTLVVAVSLYALFIYTAINSTTTAMNQMQFGRVATGTSNGFTTALISRSASSSVTPASPVDLLRDSEGLRLDFASLLLGGELFDQSDLLLGDDAFDFSTQSGVPLDRRIAALQAAEVPTAEEDPDRQAFSIGQVVYCLPEQPWSEVKDDPALWFMVAFQFSAQNIEIGRSWAFTLWVSFANGNTYNMYFSTNSEFVEALDVQDQVRADVGLSPIKDMMLELYERLTKQP